MKLALLVAALFFASNTVLLALAPAPVARAGRRARVLVFALAHAAEAGPAVIELANFGQDAHDLRVQRIGARHIAGTPVVQPGRRAELTVKLAPGRYSFWCSVADHRARGMRGTLIVR